MANDLNRWVGIGRLVRDAELKYLATGTPVCKFSIAVNRRIKKTDQWIDETSFLDIVLFGKAGESLNQYLVKGKQVAVEGELHQNRWEQDGQARSKIEVNADNVQLLGGGQGQAQTGADGKGAGATAQSTFTPRSGASGSGDSHDPNSEPPDFPDDIPF